MNNDPQMGMRQFYKCCQNDEIGCMLCSQLGWSHNRLINRAADKSAREYYLREALAQGWSVRQTEREGSFRTIS